MYKFQIVKLIMVSVLALTFMACGSDDEVETPKTTAPVIALAFNALNPPVSVPGPLSASSSQKAEEIVDILRSANAITSYGSYFIVPEDAEVSQNPVAGSSVQSPNTTVYSWTFNNGSQFVNTAYQISEAEGNYQFEIYFDFGDGLSKSLEGRESVNELRNGFLIDYGLNGSSQIQLDYEWTESSADGFNITLINAGKRIEIHIANDNSGAADVFINDIPNASYTWDGAGTSGSYIYFNSNGTVLQSGNWAG